jgi:predicted N-acetyltransferase YhbS
MTLKNLYNSSEPLDKNHDRSLFDCGVEPLNEYLKRYALQNQKKNAARTYVVTVNERSVVGYYTLVFGYVEPEDAPSDIVAGSGRYSIPIILLARLAVDKDEMGKGLGKALVRDALLRAIRAADIAGLRAFVVHAKGKEAKEFYLNLGFIPAAYNELNLYMKISDIRAALAD